MADGRGMNKGRHIALEGRGVLAVGGPDRFDFLQGMVSNDVRRVAGGRAVYAAFLTPQGKWLHDLFVAPLGEEILLDCESGDRLADLKRRLSMYKLRSRVTIEDRSADFTCFALVGQGAASAFGLDADDAGAAVDFADGRVMVDPRLAAAGLRAILPNAGGAEALIGAGFEPADSAFYDRHRLQLGLPDGSRDMIQEKSILLECGFDELRGVDFEKGCYMGQELTARTKHRGLIKKRLLPVTIEGEAPAFGAEITCDGHDAGDMRSSLGDVGLAMIRMEALTSGRPLECGGAVLTPLVPDWAVLPEH